MPKAEPILVRGGCGAMVITKTWKQGHSIKCKKRGGSSNRYWQPDKSRYWWGQAPAISDIKAEVIDYCRTCEHWLTSEQTLTPEGKE